MNELVNGDYGDTCGALCGADNWSIARTTVIRRVAVPAQFTSPLISVPPPVAHAQICMAGWLIRMSDILAAGDEHQVRTLIASILNPASDPVEIVFGPR